MISTAIRGETQRGRRLLGLLIQDYLNLMSYSIKETIAMGIYRKFPLIKLLSVLSLCASLVVLQLTLAGASFAARPSNPALSSLLFDAIHSGDSVTIQKLLKSGADPDSRDSDGRPALFVASYTGETEEGYHPFKSVQLLIQYGADVNARDKTTGETPLMNAAGTDSLDAVKLLLQHDASINARDDDGNTALMTACRSEGDERPYAAVNAADYLIDRGVNVNAVDINGDTALMQMAWNGGYPVDGEYVQSAIKIARVLLGHGASLNIKDKTGKTALDLARANHFHAMVWLIKQK
jgi:ankyrin repeat protein